MVSAVDEQLGRVLDTLRALDMWDDTLVVVTSDHGEQLGDQSLLGKGGPFESSYHVLGIVRDPRHPEAHGGVVTDFTENVDILPTICEAIGVEVPAQCDGMPLTPFLEGGRPPWWRDAAHWEYDWRWEYIFRGPYPWPWDRRLEAKHLTVLRSESVAYVQYGDGQWRCFDLGTDPGWGTEVTDPGVVLRLRPVHAHVAVGPCRPDAQRHVGVRRRDRPNPRQRDMTLPELLELLASMGSDPSEETSGLSELDHGLQCAFELAEAHPGDRELAVAGLVHDIGHRFGPDDRHGVLGAEQVRAVLGERVAGLVEAHVPAKRYLVTTDATYAVAALGREHAYPRGPRRCAHPRRADRVRLQCLRARRRRAAARRRRRQGAGPGGAVTATLGARPRGRGSVPGAAGSSPVAGSPGPST